LFDALFAIQSGIRGKHTQDFFPDLLCHAARNNSLHLSRFCKNRHAPCVFSLRKKQLSMQTFFSKLMAPD